MNRSFFVLVVAALAVGCTAPYERREKKEAPAKKAAPDEKADAKAGTKKPPDAKEEPKRPPRRVKQVPPPGDVAAPPANAKKTESGVAYVILEKGKGGETAGANDAVQVNFTGWRTDGETHDTNDGRPARKFSLARVVPGLRDGVMQIPLGGKARLWIPEKLAYQARDQPMGPLTYDVEVTEIFKAPEVPKDVAAPPADAEKTKSGLAFEVLTKGRGRKNPRAWDKVKVHYTGWKTNGEMFDSSVMRGREAEFALNKVIAGWTEGVQLMTEGEKRRFWIPKELAYEGKPGKPEGMLVFDIELISFEEMPEPPKAPDDVAAPPADAKKTGSGLAYKVLTAGTGKAKPTEASEVTVHYSGWTTDGKMFDSSVVRGQPASFPLKNVIKGWTEGLQLMVVGEKTRFWIPKELAYNDRPGKPAGMLVFDVELIEIK